jgi:hypothetical protein
MNAVASNPLTPDERLRRVMIVCCHFLRNLAFYSAGWRYDTHLQRRDHRTSAQFWVNANSNSIDICVLEWCKLFAEKKGKHRWSRIVADPEFERKLLLRLGLTADEFEGYVEQMWFYRSKFIAHLDDERTMNIPLMRVARKSIAFLYDHLRQVEDKTNALRDVQQSAEQFYRFWFGQGRQAYFEHDQND